MARKFNNPNDKPKVNTKFIHGIEFNVDEIKRMGKDEFVKIHKERFKNAEDIYAEVVKSEPAKVVAKG